MVKNLNKYILVSGTAAALLFSTSFIFAQNTRLDDLLRIAQTRSQQARQQIQQLREQAQAQAKQIRDNAKQKIIQVRDERKKTAAEKIESQFDRINMVWTDHFTNVLDRLDALLQKIESRTEKASANGQDMTATKIAIQNAVNKIAAARTTVANQAQKTYVVDATAITGSTSTEIGQVNLVSKLREQFKTLRDQLFRDLTLLRDGAMKDARTAVQDSLKALSQVPNVDEEPEASSNNQ